MQIPLVSYIHTVVSQIDRKIALIIVLYFSISLTNIALKYEVEWFPLFSFKFFSRIPGEFSKYDIVFDLGSDKERYLLHGNDDHNAFERRDYERWLATIDQDRIDVAGYEHLLEGATTVSLVKFSGDWVEAVKHSTFDRQVILKIK